MRHQEETPLNPAVASELFRAHHDQLKRFLMGILRDPQLAQDAMQSAMERLLERGHEARPEARKAWLFQVGLNEARQILRRQRVARRAVQALGWTIDDSDQHSRPDVVYSRSEQIEEVKRCVDRLSEDQKRIVRMRIYEEKTFAEIAAELQIPLGTALSRMRAALGQLRKSLDDR